MSHVQWVGLSVAVIGLLVRLLKSQRVPPPFDRIKPKARVVVALVLGQASGVIELAAVAGSEWKTVALGGIVSSAVAVLGHDFFIEYLLDGREPAQTKAPIEVRPEERVPLGTPTDPGRPPIDPPPLS